MQHIQAVIFDLDNTLLDRTRTFRSFAARFIAAYFGHVKTTEDILERIIVLDQDGYKDKSELFDELLDEMPWKAKPLKSELMSFYETEYVNNAVLMNQAKEVLKHVKSKYQTALITNGRTAIQYGKIDKLDIRKDFDCILVSEEAGVKKPDPTIYRMAIDRLGLQPDQCIYVGDHPINDIQGAADCGMEAIWLKVNQPWREELTAKPLYVIFQLEELLHLL
ncbi:HAD family hydrolase [Paenibacillus nanensis]|uniref:HAD family hydrolase n=1 Tax=Paenibacillus nanensis TaxID=393251 RepID=A0A3A1V2U5_9BACL|nr:HAD family hydrolase [Paenibacillus nanensis]RIX53682.1 HAD family hydrolase [Paenibacillus nanensis]